ncbi:3-dehydroquinate synthase [Arcticibacter pallidicorallinus]|uniref:3-dehydroquinate synthase n=1 Tax=Arcticibacter pallidicorallinus TaxID=1259464 RepID=A0A2T0UC65_9SPHI|nr:hypothetical protein [Arcticibacter pallidicorallinus]PRY55513.1 3-dehydroquinate synthase [Arcticibacter pallidicorallinus]
MDRVFKISLENTLTYEIKRVTNIFDENNPALGNHIKTHKAYCLIDRKLINEYLAAKAYFSRNGIEAYHFLIDASEKSKDLQTVIDFTSFCFKNGIGRRDSIIAIGGGIVCDLAGMSANLIRRGTPCIKIPTTLLGIIDASVGVKNGINYAGCKNSLGTFYLPDVVFIDLDFLDTLPLCEIKNGLIEMIKIISLKDNDSWHLLKRNIHNFLLKKIDADVIELIDRSIYFMLEELRDNLFEENLYRVVDYGHEFGHLIEVLTNFEISHGEAVGIGMRLSNNLAYVQGLMDKSHYEDFVSVLDSLNMPSWHSALTCQQLFDKKEVVTKHKGGNFSIVALRKIGDPFFLSDFSFSEFEYACNDLVAKDELALSKASTHY